MTITPSTRRAFLGDAGRAATAAWLSLPWLAALAGCIRDDALTGAAFAGFTPAETRAMEAFASRILPSVNGAPGAVELGAVAFVERALGEPFFAASAPVVQAGLADLDARARALDAILGFASLDADRQAAILRQVERESFFKIARTLVLIGALADPSYGGNRDGAGWTMVGLDHRPTYTAPFGYYDAPADAVHARSAA